MEMSGQQKKQKRQKIEQKVELEPDRHISISLFFIMGGNLSEMIGRTIWKNRPGRDFSVMKVPE